MKVQITQVKPIFKGRDSQISAVKINKTILGRTQNHGLHPNPHNNEPLASRLLHESIFEINLYITSILIKP